MTEIKFSNEIATKLFKDAEIVRINGNYSEEVQKALKDRIITLKMINTWPREEIVIRIWNARLMAVMTDEDREQLREYNNRLTESLRERKKFRNEKANELFRNEEIIRINDNYQDELSKALADGIISDEQAQNWSRDELVMEIWHKRLDVYMTPEDYKKIDENIQASIRAHSRIEKLSSK